MFEKCGNLVQRGVMTEPRPCIRRKGHSWLTTSCTPDLTGMVFGGWTVLKLTESYRKVHTMWLCKFKNENFEIPIRANALINGTAPGKKTPKGFGFASVDGKNRPEYATVKSHFHNIFKRKDGRCRAYQGMPFYAPWNPEEGGSFVAGAKWLIENLGFKPGPAWSLDIIKHEIGFWPGNLRWAQKETQNRNQRHKRLGLFTDEEFLIEAKRRGFICEKQKDFCSEVQGRCPSAEIGNR